MLRRLQACTGIAIFLLCANTFLWNSSMHLSTLHHGRFVVESNTTININVPQFVDDAQVTMQHATVANWAGQSPSSHSNPSEQLQLIQAEDVLIESPSTIVTAYYAVKSKHSERNYSFWMANMLSLQDPMVIFTSRDYVDKIASLRRHAINRTVIIPFNLSQVEVAQRYDQHFWQQQLDRDPEKLLHRSYQLFWIWLSKSFFVNIAIKLNHLLFKSDVFMWSDIGCFRNATFNGKRLIQKYELIPNDRILQMSHAKRPKAPPYVWWNKKIGERRYYYHSGAQAIGYKATWIRFHREFTITVDGMVHRNMFIGEDQTIMQSTCLRVPDLCAYIPARQVRDGNYYGLRTVLHYGGNYQYWYPPVGLPAEQRNASLSNGLSQIRS